MLSSSLSSSSSPSRSFSTYRYGIAILIVTMTLFFSLASVFSLSSLLWRLRRPPSRRDVVCRRGSDPSSSSRPRAGHSDWDRRPGTVSRWRSPKSALVAPPCEEPGSAPFLIDFQLKSTIGFHPCRTSVFDPLGPVSRERPFGAFLSYVCSRFNYFAFRDHFTSSYQPHAPKPVFALFIGICLSPVVAEHMVSRHRARDVRVILDDTFVDR